MMVLLILLSMNAFAMEAVQIDYTFGDKHVVHVIDEKGLKIVSGATTVKRKLDKDDYKWIEEKLAILKTQAAKDCGDQATLEITQKGRETFVVCGDKKEAREFLSVLSIK